MSKNKLLAKGERILSGAYDAGRRRSRADDKRAGVDYQRIYSKTSLDQHNRMWAQFADWAHNKGLKRLSQVTEESVREFIADKASWGGRDGKGATAKTLKSYLTAINKVMTIGGAWGDDQRVTLSDTDVQVRADREAGYKHQTAEEWLAVNPEQAERHAQLIETAQAFGLRSRELQELNERSFVRDASTGKLYVQTIGKGGKFRVAECREDMERAMLDRYGQHVRELDVHQLREKNLRDAINREELRLNIKGASGHNLPKHVFRSQYAQKLLEQKLAEYGRQGGGRQPIGWSALDKLPKDQWGTYTIKMGTYSGDARAFLEVSRALGHNRLDVLTRYLYAR